MISSAQLDTDETEIQINQGVVQYLTGSTSARWARVTCFLLIAIVNLSSWIDLQGLSVEIPLIVPFTPERWSLPSMVSMCISAANIMPVLVVLLRWRLGKRFSEIPFIYMIIIVGIIAGCVLALFWQRTVFFFGRERSMWLFSCIFILSMLDCTSSLVFFDYMKRFRAEYLTAAFLGEALTSVISTILVLAQGVAGETICVQNSNGTALEPSYTQPRFSVKTFMFCIAIIIVASLIAFVLLRWTRIISLADAAQPDVRKIVLSTTYAVDEEDIPMIPTIEPETPSKSVQPMTRKMFKLLLLVNGFNATIAYGLLPSLSTYSLLPYGQKAFYYSSVLTPIAYPIALLLRLRWKIVSIRIIVVGSIVTCALSAFIFVIAAQSPCPWWADTTHGALIIITIWFFTLLGSCLLRITIGNRIKSAWAGDKGMFYFGGTDQLGSVLGTIPIFLFINVFGLFIDRKPCQTYCLT